MISTFTAFFDANVFFGARLRSLVLELSKSGLFRARWSEHVHDEWIAAVLAKRADIDPIKLRVVRQLMNEAVPDCLVTGYEELIPSLSLPDPSDRHVLAAAILGSASVIVTFNESDFPQETLSPFGIHTRHPDLFLLETEGLDPGSLVRALECDRRRYRNPPLTVDQYVGDLRRAGLPRTADYLDRLKVLIEPSVATDPDRSG
jgi:hypothetical protein